MKQLIHNDTQYILTTVFADPQYNIHFYIENRNNLNNDILILLQLRFKQYCTCETIKLIPVISIMISIQKLIYQQSVVLCTCEQHLC